MSSYNILLSPFSLLQKSWWVNAWNDSIESIQCFYKETMDSFWSLYSTLTEEYVLDHKLQPSQIIKCKCFLIAFCMLIVATIKQCYLSYKGEFVAQPSTPKTAQTIEYFHGDKKYKLVLFASEISHISSFVKATCEDEKDVTTDVTEDIKMLLGPYEDWNHQVYTPAKLGYTKLTIAKICDENFETIQQTFEADEQLPSLKDIQKCKAE